MEPVEPVHMNIYQSKPMEKAQVGYISTMSQGFKRGSKRRNILHIHPFNYQLQLIIASYNYSLFTSSKNLEASDKEEYNHKNLNIL